MLLISPLLSNALFILSDCGVSRAVAELHTVKKELDDSVLEDVATDADLRANPAMRSLLL